MSVTETRLTAIVLIAMLLGGGVCQCQGGCSSHSDTVDQLPGGSCCRPHPQENRIPQNFPHERCCCELGLCDVDAARIPTTENPIPEEEFGPPITKAEVCSSARVSGGSGRAHSERNIWPTLNTGRLLPELTSLLI